MNKINSIILHVGGDKTGSTAIQNSLLHNKNLLAEKGYYYPPHINAFLLATNFSENPHKLDHYRAVNRLNYRDVKKEATAYTQALESSLNNGNYHTLVLSYEGFLGLNSIEMHSLKRFLNRFSDNIKVIYYLRPHLSYAPSAISQRIRLGSLAWHQHPPVTYYMPRLDLLSDVFSDEALCLKRFSKSDLEKGDIVTDFFTQMDLPPQLIAQIEQDNSDTNNSLSEEAILIGNAMARLLAPVSGPSRPVVRQLFSTLLGQIKGGRYQLNSLQKDVILRATRQDTRLVLKKYGIDLGSGEALSSSKELSYEEDARSLSAQTAHSLARILINQILPELTLPDIEPSNSRECIVYRAQGGITVIDQPTQLETSKYSVTAQITNNSNYWWGGHIAPVCASYHWLAVNGEPVEFEGQRTFLPEKGIEPGSSVMIDLLFHLPDKDGEYQLEITLVQEFYHWFEDIKFCTQRISITIQNNDLKSFRPL